MLSVSTFSWVAQSHWYHRGQIRVVFVIPWSLSKSPPAAIVFWLSQRLRNWMVNSGQHHLEVLKDTAIALPLKITLVQSLAMMIPNHSWITCVYCHQIVGFMDYEELSRFGQDMVNNEVKIWCTLPNLVEVHPILIKLLNALYAQLLKFVGIEDGTRMPVIVTSWSQWTFWLTSNLCKDEKVKSALSQCHYIKSSLN